MASKGDLHTISALLMLIHRLVIKSAKLSGSDFNLEMLVLQKKSLEQPLPVPQSNKSWRLLTCHVKYFRISTNIVLWKDPLVHDLSVHIVRSILGFGLNYFVLSSVQKIIFVNPCCTRV